MWFRAIALMCQKLVIGMATWGFDGELKLLKWFWPFGCQEIQHFDVP